MTATCFVDTNVLVYYRDASEPEKQARAKDWLGRLWQSRRGRLSVQVLNEYYAVVTQRLTPGLDRGAARADVRSLMAWRPVTFDRLMLEGAWTVQDRYGFSWWDALIVAAAQRAGCDILLSEDMQPGQDVDGVTIVNPFTEDPDRLLSAS